MPSIPGFLTNTPLHPSFDKDIRDTHLIYDYDAQDENGKPEKWRYEMWFFSENRIVYAIHGGTWTKDINQFSRPRIRLRISLSVAGRALSM